MPDGSRKTLPVVRPVTRADCANVPRPCPFRECRYHLDEGGAYSPCGGRGKRRGISDADMDQISEWYRDGVTVTEIARRMPYTHSGIRAALIRSGLKDGKAKRFSCALDAADEGGMDDREIAAELGITVARVNQIAAGALKKLHRRLVGVNARDYFADGPIGWTEPHHGRQDGEED